MYIVHLKPYRMAIMLYTVECSGMISLMFNIDMRNFNNIYNCGHTNDTKKLQEFHMRRT